MLILKNTYRNSFFLFYLLCTPSFMFGEERSESYEYESSSEFSENDLEEKSTEKRCRHRTLSYYLYVADFIQSFIEIPTSNVLIDSSTIASSYLAGRASIYDEHNEVVGNCTASFLNIQNSNGIYTDISNYLSVDNGLVVSWFTPTTLVNLELDSIVHSMVTECIVLANTKIGFNPFYGDTFNMIVSSDSGKIYFKLSRIPN